ncbi:hypothetical protein DN396_01685 [Bacillus sp. BF9-10]|nr:hypothetical protein FHY73_22370 [Bacillus tropicus]TXR89662.1 hypothetical protein DN396_01685 [Bacillus sp. BF9-10]
MLTRSPPYTAVFTHHFTCVYCISKILSCKKNSPSSFPKSKILIRLFKDSKTSISNLRWSKEVKLKMDK